MWICSWCHLLRHHQPLDGVAGIAVRFLANWGQQISNPGSLNLAWRSSRRGSFQRDLLWLFTLLTNQITLRSPVALRLRHQKREQKDKIMKKKKLQKWIILGFARTFVEREQVKKKCIIHPSIIRPQMTRASSPSFPVSLTLTHLLVVALVSPLKISNHAPTKKKKKKSWSVYSWQLKFFPHQRGEETKVKSEEEEEEEKKQRWPSFPHDKTEYHSSPVPRIFKTQTS